MTVQMTSGRARLRLYVRRPRLFLAGAAALALVAGLNHLLPPRDAARATEPDDTIVVRSEDGPAGHSTLGLDETKMEQEPSFLRFATLGLWDYAAGAATPCPEPVKAADGKTVRCIGFMYPLAAGEKTRAFCLLRSTQTCCYGPKPQFNQYIFVEMKEPVRFERLAPVIVSGKFFVDPRPQDGYIYRMEGESVRAVKDDTPEVDAEAAARNAGLPLFDFTPLDAMRSRLDKTIDPSLAAMDGRKVVLNGWITDRTDDSPPRLVVVRPPSSGAPPLPTVYDAVLVMPRDARQVPPLWRQQTTFTGVVRITKDPSQWSERGIVRLTGAILGVPGAGVVESASPRRRIPVALELGLLTMLLAATVRIRPPASTESARA